MGDKENDADEIITIDAVRDFLLKHNGKARQIELVNHFRTQLNSPSTKVRARQEFKDILQLISANKTENGEKYVILAKQSQQASQSSVIMRKSNRPLSIRKEMGRSQSLGVPLTPGIYDVSDEEDNISSHASDSGISDTSSIRSVASLKGELVQRLPISKSVDSVDTLIEGDEDLEEDLGLEGDEVLPEEKEWMMAAAHGNLKKLEKLLDDYPMLAGKKDFIMTALHWAAKLGRPDIVKFIVTAGVDVHSKSGYTPLHIAAMSGRDIVIKQLIEFYSANIHARDHSGKKPRDVVRDTVAPDVQRKLGRSLILDPNHEICIVSSMIRKPITRSRPSSLVKTDDESSPHSTPEMMRKNLKSISVSAQRSMSFLRKKKKDRLRPEDIELSPQPVRRLSHNFDTANNNANKKVALFERRKSDIVTNKRPKSLVISEPTKLKPTLGESTVSFEI